MKEEEIRPRHIFEKYLELASKDAELYFGHSKRQKVLCPACQRYGNKSFVKHGFCYEVCSSCQTLYVSPRPPAQDFYSYYLNSESAKFFASTFYHLTAEKRREQLWRPKARWVADQLQELNAKIDTIYDIGGGYGIFAEEYHALTGRHVTVIEPGSDLASICRSKGLQVIESFLEEVSPDELETGTKLFVSFELFEHLHDCRLFLDRLGSLMLSGDKFIFSTLSSTGLDIQALWENSNSISLQHLNFFNPTSIAILLETMGFKILSVTTPGKLDMDIMYNNKEQINDRFWRTLVSTATREELQAWQQFIVSCRCSSHMLVVCERI